ncbi:hypothetical protein T484DRAFT_1753729 [Baffinella frigidus]|nr:hypothetical protein T484DRAFT_1753729 [Cryptophyta sp. CCMP2293]
MSNQPRELYRRTRKMSRKVGEAGEEVLGLEDMDQLMMMDEPSEPASDYATMPPEDGSSFAGIQADLLLRIAFDCTGFMDFRTLCRIESVCKNWRSILTDNDEPWKLLTNKRYPRTAHPDVEKVEWGDAADRWKKRYQKMRAVRQVASPSREPSHTLSMRSWAG